MPLFEYSCRKCGAITEVLVFGFESRNQAVRCSHCGAHSVSKIVSQVSFKVAKAAKYSDEFLHHARPFLSRQRETAAAFAEGKGSEDSRTFQLAERIGERIDKTLATRLPTRKR